MDIKRVSVDNTRASVDVTLLGRGSGYHHISASQFSSFRQGSVNLSLLVTVITWLLTVDTLALGSLLPDSDQDEAHALMDF